MSDPGFLRSLLLALLVGLVGCAPRSSQVVTVPVPIALDEATARRLVVLWQTRFCSYIAEQGGGDTGALAELRRLRSRDVLRPARVRFGVLDIDTGAGRWDVQGVLVGRQKSGVFVRYVFVVGIIGHSEYLSSEIRDLRLVALSPLAERLVWETSASDRGALERYRDRFGRAAASRFPAHEDDFRMMASRGQVSVQEIRSGATWSLEVRTDLRNTYGATVSVARGRADEDPAERCRPR